VKIPCVSRIREGQGFEIGLVPNETLRWVAPFPETCTAGACECQDFRTLARELRIPAILNIPLGAGTEQVDGDSASNVQLRDSELQRTGMHWN
jgi:hypothetical protein